MVWRRWLLVVLGARAHAHYQVHEKWLWWEVQGRAGAVLVAYEEDLNGGGLAFGMDLVRHAYNAVGFNIGRCLEFCAGPAFIGFALVAAGVCDTLALSDRNPEAVAAIKWIGVGFGRVVQTGEWAKHREAPPPPPPRPPNGFDRARPRPGDTLVVVQHDECSDDPYIIWYSSDGQWERMDLPGATVVYRGGRAREVCVTVAYHMMPEDGDI